MKNTTNNAIAAFTAIVAGTAKTNILRTVKTFLLLFFAGLTLALSSCSRNGVGCNSFACKSNLKYSNERKYAKFSSTIYKCPANQRYSR